MELYCPTCKKEVEWEGNEWKPFCSERCKIIDLGEWASESYKVVQVDSSEEEFE